MGRFRRSSAQRWWRLLRPLDVLQAIVRRACVVLCSFGRIVAIPTTHVPVRRDEGCSKFKTSTTGGVRRKLSPLDLSPLHDRDAGCAATRDGKPSCARLLNMPCCRRPLSSNSGRGEDVGTAVPFGTAGNALKQITIRVTSGASFSAWGRDTGSSL